MAPVAPVDRLAQRDGLEHHHHEADVDLLRLASDLVVDAVVEPERLRDELAARLAQARTKRRGFSERHHGVPPV